MRKIKNVISVIYSLIKFSIIKLFNLKKFKFSFIERFSPNTIIEIRGNARLEFGKRVRAHNGTKFNVSNNGFLKVGDNTSFNDRCIIACHKKIEIGKDCTFGPNVMVYDHDHDYMAEGIINGKKFKTDDVRIGNNCWIGANTIILRGTSIGDNCVVGAGTVLKGAYGDNLLIVQKRETIEKIIKK